MSTAEKAWRRLRDRAGIPDGRPHDLRHTAGTFAALAAANAFAVRDLLARTPYLGDDRPLRSARSGYGAGHGRRRIEPCSGGVRCRQNFTG